MNTSVSSTPQINESQESSYFENSYKNSEINSFEKKLQRFWQGFQYYARQVWPWIYRLINFLVYNTLKVLKAIVKIGLQQIGLMKD